VNYRTSFAACLRRQRKSRATVRNYSYALDEYLSYYRRHRRYFKISAALEPQRLEGYVRYLLDQRGLRPSTVNGRLTALSSFARFLVGRGILSANPVDLVSRVCKDGNLKRDNQVPWQAVQELRQQANQRRTFLQLRNHLIVELLYTGMTVSELRSLKWDGRRSGDYPSLRLGEREIKLHPEARAALDIYLIFRPSLRGSYLIVGKGPDGSLTPGAVYGTVKRLADKTGTRIRIRDLRLAGLVPAPMEERVAA
jgi:site-specific recombinase XerD